MDLRLFLRVLWRFRFLVATGMLLALVLAFLAFMRVSFEDGSPRISYREKETWQSQGLLFVTQRGFPWGRSVIESEEEESGEALPAGKAGQKAKERPRFADSNRVGYLAILYATLATSDPVQSLVLRDGPLNGTIEAAPVLASETLAEDLRPFLRFETPLPLVRISARAASPEQARSLARREINAFLAFLERRQEANGIPPSERVTVTVLERPREAGVVAGRSKIYATLLLLAIVGATLTLAFVLENLRPRVRPVRPQEPRPAPVVEASRRSA